MSGQWRLEGGRFRQTGGVPLSDRGFRYGMSVFESLAVRRGRLIFADEHLALLETACRQAAFIFPRELPAALSALRLEQDGLLRIYVTAGDGRPAEPAADCRAYALFEMAAFPSPDDILAGFRLQAFPAHRSSDWGRKTGNYWPHLDALTAAHNAACDESLVINAENRVVSAAMANVFFVFDDGRLHTPEDATGCRNGAVKSWLCKRHAAGHTAISLENALKARECFLTNSRLGIMPVAKICERVLPSQETGRRLASQYREEILGE